MVDRLTGKIAIVTGAGQGIGAAIATVFAREGAAVVIAERNRATGAAIAQAIAGGGARSLFVETDIAERVSVEAMVAQAVVTFGGVDILVNNAGVNVFHEPLETTDEEWRRCLAVDLEGAWIASRAVLPGMRARSRGAIVNIASSRAHQSEPDTEAYAASKGGIVAFTHALAVSAGPVRVNAINPGWIAVDDWRKPSRRRRPHLTHADHAQHPVGRVGLPGDIGALVVFLLSPRAGFITGENFTVDGGMARRMHYV